ncbi:basigin-like isoform X1 [Amphibalanus amphitrite]|uniref:basigin-like isoform X1 n=1 Tax=Amphibalanus amphitrite TaxID=1232801 RepID=UPI001C92995B|nr:basigin-like isoform X1 [Amphibalanus amphitrite]
MKKVILAVALHVFFISACNAVAPAMSVRTSADDTDRLLVMPRHPFIINCSLENSDAPNVLVVSWYKSSEGSDRKKINSTDRVKTAGDSLVILEPSPMDDPGNYTCVFDVKTAEGRPEATVQVIANVTVRMPGVSINKMEGEDLMIHCKMRGKPWPVVHWTKDAHPIAEAIGNASTRLQLEQDELGFPSALLSLSTLRRPDDVGDYCCHAQSVANAAVGCTIVRVKDKYAALWPVIGIVAELLLLAAIISFCESRKPKPAVVEDPDQESSTDKSVTAAPAVPPARVVSCDSYLAPPPPGQTAGDVRQRK